MFSVFNLIVCLFTNHSPLCHSTGVAVSAAGHWRALRCHRGGRPALLGPVCPAVWHQGKEKMAFLKDLFRVNLNTFNFVEFSLLSNTYSCSSFSSPSLLLPPVRASRHQCAWCWSSRSQTAPRSPTSRCRSHASSATCVAPRYGNVILCGFWCDHHFSSSLKHTKNMPYKNYVCARAYAKYSCIHSFIHSHSLTHSLARSLAAFSHWL